MGEYTLPLRDPITRDQMVRASHRWMDRSLDEFGALHIVVGDGNVDDSHLVFCSHEDGLTREEASFLVFFSAMATEDREEAWLRTGGGYVPYSDRLA